MDTFSDAVIPNIMIDPMRDRPAPETVRQVPLAIDLIPEEAIGVRYQREVPTILPSADECVGMDRDSDTSGQDIECDEDGFQS